VTAFGPTISNLAIKGAFVPTIPPAMVYTSGALYSVPTLDYLQNAFYDYWLSTLGTLSTWQAKWECWNFTSDYLSTLQRANADTALSPTSTTALAAGRWDFHPDSAHVGGVVSLDNHSIACIFTDQGIVRIDPQNNTLWQPSQNELLSTRLLLF